MLATKHHPFGGSTRHYDNERVESLIAEYKSTGDLGTLSEIVEATQDRIETLIRFCRTERYRPMGELISDCHFKLLRGVNKFNPEKGTAFSFVSRVILNALHTSVTVARQERDRYREMDEAALDRLVTKSETESQHGIDDLAHRVRCSVRTTLASPEEQDVARWYVKSFCDASFEQCRHECADAAMTVHGINHGRSRELYDLTMLEVRRVLYDDIARQQPIAAGRLFGSRQAWMTRYAPLMNAEEFTKFAVLMRDLAPYLVLLIDNSRNCNRRQDRSPAVGRKNIELILCGHPDAAPLFGESAQ